MKPSLGLLTFWFAVAYAQTYQECTQAVARTNECADVINANACYNQDRFGSARTLQCVDGKDNKERSAKVCKCCTCVGTVMCNWATKQKLC
ncbi:hypothetical protein B0J11DRAFT_448509 [Dendryphion nanum]|uniref:Uncharacterized protein n=1 Tax=Dendryphion nanum TaxID=256645 RepID=A0A9P9CZZ4_9PLEO|nr:hypothetical protein B0J11DRAFT_448509 [Dendryphion nanum]